ncbi:hypothetical protein KM043_014841 [Ampulex compressa]|nr:hypothetical protein KM043_014841 [Ampulex compressa]
MSEREAWRMAKRGCEDRADGRRGTEWKCGSGKCGGKVKEKEKEEERDGEKDEGGVDRRDWGGRPLRPPLRCGKLVKDDLLRFACRYAKTVVDSSLTAQRYNPEFTVTTMSSTRASYGNTNTSVLIDQLRHINQVVLSQLASAPDSGTLLADEALDGSGSGDRPGWRKKGNGEDIDNDDEDVNGDHDDDEASGSGMGLTTPDPWLKKHREKTTVAGSSGLTGSVLLLSIVCAPLVA